VTLAAAVGCTRDPGGIELSRSALTARKQRYDLEPLPSNADQNVLGARAPFGGAVALVVSVAPSDRAIATDEDIREIVEILDENGDGLVDREEFLRQKTVIFSRAISDRRPDQGVTPEEINITSEAFAAADLNGDGKLSGGEFVQAPFTRFEAIDANSDQKITFEELRDFLQRYRPGG
jgi:EF-hand domain pair/EF hand